MLRTAPPPLECHGNSFSTTTGSDVLPAEEAWDAEVFLDLSDPLEVNKEEEQQLDSCWIQDGDMQGCGQLERKWVLWHEFMKEYTNLDTWLRLAEQAISSPNSAHVTYITAKEELQKFERLQQEAGSRLIQLDSLTHQNRMLTQLFQGAMRARLLAAVKECGRRWDDVNAKLETMTGQLKLFLSEWEEFEAEREELSLWLADLDVRLIEVEHLTGNTCDKMRRLQSFQQCVCVNSGRVNALLQCGEALIQRSEPPDAQRVESHLLELLHRCSHVYNNIARTHTRLLSMRLVFEDDCILSQAPDSGCPSETLLEEEGALDKPHLDILVTPNHPQDFSQSADTALALPLDLPPPPSSPTHEHLGLEWDPSVDIGRSVSHDDADSSYFSASTGLCYRDGRKRRSYLSSQSDISNDIVTNQETDMQLEGWLERAQPHVFSPITPQGGGNWGSRDQWVTSTPDSQDCEPFSFDGGRVRAWLGVQSPAHKEGRTSCSKSVQTDGEVNLYKEKKIGIDYQTQPYLKDIRHHHDNKQELRSIPTSSLSPDLQGSFDWTRHRRQSNLQEDVQTCCEAVRVLSEERVTSSRRALSFLLSPAFFYLLLAVALALLVWLIWGVLEPSCHHSNRMLRSFHIALRYVNGPPPT
ncbi:hypothetical protein LDENG_00040360 [Lucifuga dentata]|nr:hypothetical protein LDENG_00040360 [Lucifuga dentata]